MPRPTIQPPALFTEEDVLAVDLEIDAALSGAFETAEDYVPAEATHVDDDDIDGLLDDGFFEQAVTDGGLSLDDPALALWPTGTSPEQPVASPSRPSGEAMEAFHSSAMIVAALVPMVAFATGAAFGDINADIAWDTAPAAVLAGLLAAAAFGYARRSTLAFASCIHAVYLARMAVDSFGPEATGWTVVGTGVGAALLAGAAAYLSVPLIGRSKPADDDNRRLDPVL